jgi:hypothetical protein
MTEELSKPLIFDDLASGCYEHPVVSSSLDFLVFLVFFVFFLSIHCGHPSGVRLSYPVVEKQPS